MGFFNKKTQQQRFEKKILKVRKKIARYQAVLEATNYTCRCTNKIWGSQYDVLEHYPGKIAALQVELLDLQEKQDRINL